MLGLAAPGWRIEPERVRRAHVELLEAAVDRYTQYDTILKAPADTEWDTAVEALGKLLGASRFFEFVRRGARLRAQVQEESQPLSDLRWDRFAAMTEAFLYGQISDEDDLRDMIRIDHLYRGQAPMPAVDIDQGVERALELLPALSGPALIRLAQDASDDELLGAVDTVALAYVLLVVFFDFGFERSAAGSAPRRFSKVIGEDPAVLARLALVLVALKRDPAIGPSLNDSPDGLREDAIESLRFVLAQIQQPSPRLRWLLSRYMRARAAGPWDDWDPAEYAAHHRAPHKGGHFPHCSHHRPRD